MKKKKGSTLITVVALFAILFTTGTAILSLTLYSYKLKIAQSRKIENLYGSEAGIDASKKILELSVQSAIRKANLEVIETTNKINEEIEAIEEEYSKSSSLTLAQIIDDIVSNKKANYDVFLRDVSGQNRQDNTLYYVLSADNKEVVIINTDAIIEKQQHVFKDAYKAILNSNIESCFENTDNIYKYINLDSNNNVTMANFPDFPVSARLQAEYTAFGGNTYAILDLTSVFTDNSIERRIKSSYKLEIPDITNTNIINSPLAEKCIAADGNMYINSNLTVNGDIFVKGNQTTSDEDVYSKYNGGIYVNVTETEANGGTEGSPEAITVNFNGNTATASTLNIKQKSTVNINTGNLYANNINIGKLGGNDSETSGNNLNVYTDLIVDNDFTYNADGADVDINNLYAVNDRTVQGDNYGEAKKNSSSIIINNSMTSGSITIQKDAYIRGAAYINVKNASGERYQTGESIAIKGNYTAYTSPINDEDNTYTFDYYSPLQLVKDKNNNPMNTIGPKAEYFLAFVNQNGENGLANKGNITLNGDANKNFYISGAYIKGEEVQDPNVEVASKEEKLKLKRKEFANKVYEMDSFNEYSTGNDRLLEIYNSLEVKKTVGNLISIPDAGHVYKNDNSTIVGVYSDENNTDLRLTDSNSDGVNINGKKGIIITDKNIVIDGNINFTGTILTTGNITTTAGSSIYIKYDGAIVKGLIGEYGLQNIFSIATSASTQITSINMSGGTIDALGLIKNNGWRIVK